MTTQKDSTSGNDENKTNQWNRSSGPDMKPTGDDTKKTANDPEPKQGGDNGKRM